MNISNKMFKRIMLSLAAVSAVLLLAFLIINSAMDRAMENRIQEMLNSDNPETVIQGIFLGEVKLEKLKVDSASVKDGVAKMEVSYAEPYSEGETLRTFSLFAIDITQRVTQRKAADSVEYTFKCPFIDSETGQQKMDLGMACTLTKNNVASIDLEGYNQLLYDNPLKLGELTEVYYHPALERGAQ